MRSVAPGVCVWRCTEAIDPRAGFTFRTIGNDEGRCIEIITSANQMLFDRRLARQLALAILEECGPAEELPSDIAESDMVEVVYHGDSHLVAGFRPYTPRTGTSLTDAAAWVEKVRRDKGLPPARMFPLYDLPDEEHESQGHG